MTKKIVTSFIFSLTLIIGIFSFVSVNTVEAATDYNWPFKQQTKTVKLDKSYSFTGHEQYRQFNKVGLTMNFKVSANKGLTVSSVNHYKANVIWPVSLSINSDEKYIPEKTAKVGKTASAYVLFEGEVLGDKLGYSETVRADGYIKLVSIDKKKKTAKVQFNGNLQHSNPI